MKTLNSIIIDDEPLARVELRRLLSKYNHISVIGEADSVPSAINLINVTVPDLVFLDIDLGKQTGFDLLERVPHNFHVIFVTAFDDFAIRAFNVNALDYLLKPVNPARLDETIYRINSSQNIKQEYSLNMDDKILINKTRCSKLIDVSSILFIEACGDYTIINTITGTSGIVHHSIKKWLDKLPEKVFIQCHRSYIINLNQLVEFRKSNKENMEVIFENTPLTVPVSRRFSQKIKTHFTLK